jgi:hypothetical protein
MAGWREHHSDTVIKYSKTAGRKHKNMRKKNGEEGDLEEAGKKLFCK